MPSSRQLQGNQEVTAASKEGLLHRLENMDFSFYVIYCFMKVDSMDFGHHALF
jgi:hypothetical protein